VDRPALASPDLPGRTEYLQEPRSARSGFVTTAQARSQRATISLPKDAPRSGLS
jgi:hypothetical protein